MNSDILKGKWKQMKGDLKIWWGRLTEDDFDQIAGSKDRLIGKIQERYGYNKERAEREVEERIGTFDDRHVPAQ